MMSSSLLKAIIFILPLALISLLASGDTSDCSCQPKDLFAVQETLKDYNACAVLAAAEKINSNTESKRVRIQRIMRKIPKKINTITNADKKFLRDLFQRFYVTKQEYGFTQDGLPKSCFDYKYYKEGEEVKVDLTRTLSREIYNEAMKNDNFKRSNESFDFVSNPKTCLNILLRRLNTVPPVLMLIQAKVESQIGTRGLSIETNNWFGTQGKSSQKCYRPKDNPTRCVHMYSDVTEGASAYIRNLNTSSLLIPYRLARASWEGKQCSDISQLLPALSIYAEDVNYPEKLERQVEDVCQRYIIEDACA